MGNSFIEDNNVKKSRGSSSLLFLWVILAILLFGLGIYFFRTSMKASSKVNAKIYKSEIYLNEDLIYADNTSGASKWVWEFGNGEKSNKQQGTYRYSKSGSYVVRLTVDENLKEDFILVVKDTIPIMPVDTSLFISGTTHGMILEEIRLEANGPGEAFEWWFGETNRVDAVGKSALYTYTKPGDYTVRVTSEKNPIGATHVVRILDPNPVVSTVKPSDKSLEALNELKKRIQAIADGKDFVSNYNYIISKFLCNSEKVRVQVEMGNEKRQMDIYSYLIGLPFAKGLIINDVIISSVNNEGASAECPNLITVKQSK